MNAGPEPRVLITIDYESWVVLLRRDFDEARPEQRRELDNGYVRDCLDDILSLIAGHPITIFLVGEIVDWYPQVPDALARAGHEIGFHCHSHRLIRRPEDLYLDLDRSQEWLKRFDVKGYRAPTVTTSDSNYAELARAGLFYSSSVYGPAGWITQHNQIWEVPVTTWRRRRRPPQWQCPRPLKPKLLLEEFPYGSSFFVGILGESTLDWVERDLRAGRSPLLVLHTYQLVPPPKWPRQIWRAILRDPRQFVYARSCREVLRQLLKNFPTGRVDHWLEEFLQSHAIVAENARYE